VPIRRAEGLECGTVSKAQKQRTNEKRARRLGSGEGIASTRPGRGGGGIPTWAWAAAGAIIIVAAVAVVLILHSAGTATGQQADCVQKRLSTSTLDPLSKPTWPPNYDDLQCALSALGLQPSAENTGLTHYHAHLTLYANGKQVPVPAYIGLPAAGGMNATFTSEIHTHGPETDGNKTGIIHLESPSAKFRGNLQQFFDVWGVRATGECIGGYCGGVRTWINGKPVSNGLNVKLQEHDAVTMVVGKEPPNFKPATHYTFNPGE
jgi:hypothetical protein